MPQYLRAVELSLCIYNGPGEVTEQVHCCFWLRLHFPSLLHRHIQEVVNLQAQQNKELQDLYDRLRSIKDSRSESSEVALQLSSPRRPKSFKSKLRSRPQSHSHADNGIVAGGKAMGMGNGAQYLCHCGNHSSSFPGME